MRGITKFLMGCLALLFVAGAAKSQDITLVNDTKDALVIDIDVYDVKDKECVNTAIPYAYYAVFFRGIPDSTNFKDGLVGTDENFINSHKEYFNNMESGRFNTFITTARLVDYNKKSKPKMGTVRLNINMRALIKDLEQQGVKRRFGL